MGDNVPSTPVEIFASDVVFAEATPEQRVVSWHLSSDTWAKPLTEEQYLEANEVLSRIEMARDGGCRFWALYFRGNPLEVVASCESFRKTLFVRDPTSPVNGNAANGSTVTKDDGQITEHLAYGIASVYTNPKYRRLGMASLMLHKLQEVMDNEGATGSALYSDIGRSYYSMLGWAVFPHSEARLNLLSRSRKLKSDTCCDIKTRWIERPDELEQLCKLDVDDLKARMCRQRSDDKVHFAFAPTYAQINWQLAREDFFARTLFGRDIQRRGAATTDGKSWIVWERDWKKEQLTVLRIVTTQPESEARRVDHVWALLGAAVAEASEWGLGAVAVWNPDETTTSGIKATSNAYANDVRVVFKQRDGSLPSFRWRGGLSTAKMVWEDNYYYCWC
ncbi:hypothetical protein MAPG_02455 [Magnaporthiopsis poae ATCC 64411]|uniref:LYC1 C-terminal domain-containing protein n=1 Tax=Magnaporthiopsis poae (strain ATCC 64411 / 73-15) TaxID=644358 RepID=A0A0C4DRE8_MAGP6|nr:hypothetical protein MAPG_02455 [Magnaporthiopsis poae ATCC 64411]